MNSDNPAAFPIMDDHERVDLGRGRQFPGFNIPWRIIESHEPQAKFNHDQTLKRLAERGGLSPMEAVCVLEDRPLMGAKMPKDEAFYRLARILADAMLKERSK